mgnify:CR=1 FL=1
MIKINGEVVNINKFPDGTPRINLDVNGLYQSCLEIEWYYESDAELFYLMVIKKHYENLVDYLELFLPYIPNARMDRVLNSEEVFTLKYFCEFINWLRFDSVIVLDAHSNVTPALLNNCTNLHPIKYIRNAIDYVCEDKTISEENFALYFPDYSAAKKYSVLIPEMPYCYGIKNRDWKTGKILGLDVITNGIDLKQKTVLMIDDIVSYGGSMKYGADRLKELGVDKIFAYATHTENSVLDKNKGTLLKSLENNTVERLFTTDSLFTGSHEKITVMEVNWYE